jgi:signal transduction histidine kinase/ActR/RegA family two-component response regulator
MNGPRSSSSDDGDGRLNRCIRDLAALNALPSMCVGRSPEETLDLVMDVLPTALSCQFVYLTLSGALPLERVSLHGKILPEDDLPEIRAAVLEGAGTAVTADIPRAGELWLLEAELPVGAERGRLVAGRSTPFDMETDRVLVRSAANLVGTTLEAANVLDAARRKDEFLAILGHELRNPLAPILTAVELLARQPAAAREQQVIARHTLHLARLVDDLLDISRVTRGHIELRHERVSLGAVLQRAKEIAAPLVGRHRHALHVANADGIVLEGDPVRLAQVFGNLLTNAAKFTPPHGKIDVLVDRVPGGVRVSVRDTGRGISPDQVRRIFKPFVQLEGERDARRGGLGLGLAIVNDLVERHHGTITVESAGKDRGSTFTVELPVATAAEARKDPEPPQTPKARAGVRILVVDDDVDVAELLSEALRIEGFQTSVAHDALAALQRWRSFVPHAGVLDVGLPELDGYELARTLRAEHGKDPTLIAATGYGQKSDRARAADAGFDCHLVKPVSVRDLVSVLDRRIVAPSAGGAH